MAQHDRNTLRPPCHRAGKGSGDSGGSSNPAAHVLQLPGTLWSQFRRGGLAAVLVSAWAGLWQLAVKSKEGILEVRATMCRWLQICIRTGPAGYGMLPTSHTLAYAHPQWLDLLCR